MKPLREVSKKEKIIFPIVVTVFVALLVPSAAPLIACLMLGNLFKECGVVERLSKTVQNELMNIVTIFLGISVGATATGTTFLSPSRPSSHHGAWAWWPSASAPQAACCWPSS